MNFRYVRAICVVLFLVLAGCLTAALYEPVALYLTWQRDPDTTMTVRWITPINHNDDGVDYQKVGEDNWLHISGTHFQLPNETPYILHSVELVDLQPNTRYAVRIGSEGKIYSFQTMPDNDHSPIRFVAGGDMYHDDISYVHQTNRQAAALSPQFALVGGDIAYAASSGVFGFLTRWSHTFFDKLLGQKFDRWLAWLVAWKEDMVTPEGLTIPMLPAIGNHDVNGRFGQTPADAPFFYALFPMPGPQGYNVLDFKTYMSIFLLDSGHSHPVKGEQAAWLAQSLQERQNVCNKFALYHVPAYPCVHSLSEEIGQEIRTHWVPSFEVYGLTAAFENHEHAYKRSFPIKSSTIDPKGVVYLGDGGWGVKKPRKPRYDPLKWYLAHAQSARTFLMLTIENGKRMVTGFTSDGKVIDQYSW